MQYHIQFEKTKRVLCHQTGIYQIKALSENKIIRYLTIIGPLDVTYFYGKYLYPYYKEADHREELAATVSSFRVPSARSSPRLPHCFAISFLININYRPHFVPSN